MGTTINYSPMSSSSLPEENYYWMQVLCQGSGNVSENDSLQNRMLSGLYYTLKAFENLTIYDQHFKKNVTGCLSVYVHMCSSESC